MTPGSEIHRPGSELQKHWLYAYFTRLMKSLNIFYDDCTGMNYKAILKVEKGEVWMVVDGIEYTLCTPPHLQPLMGGGEGVNCGWG